jgi:hypothetical protein
MLVNPLRHQTFQDDPLLLDVFIAVAKRDHITFLPRERDDFDAHPREKSIAELSDDDGQESSALTLDAAGGGILDIADLRRRLEYPFPQVRTDVAPGVAEHIRNPGNESPALLATSLIVTDLPVFCALICIDDVGMETFT